MDVAHTITVTLHIDLDTLGRWDFNWTEVEVDGQMQLLRGELEPPAKQTKTGYRRSMNAVADGLLDLVRRVQ